MAFLVKTDFKYSIDLTALDALTGADDSIWVELSDEAVLEMKSFLNARYDVSTIFAAVGLLRDKSIVMYCKDITLYHLYSIYAFKTIPKVRVDRYNHALQWLQDVQAQKINPDNFPLSTSLYVKYGGNDKRMNQQQ
ncbi:MAG TPA: phage protein Gp36 family protein [Chitinophagales bacterium]|nr:phage protein Gp36 family protein [Chitinophagales bacterium]